MTKKHFVALAAALREAGYSYPIGITTPETQHKRDILAITAVCARFNPNFDRDRFLAACGVESKS